MRYMSYEAVRKSTGEVWIVLEWGRGKYFGGVPKSHPAQDTIRMEKSEFTKPEWKEISHD